MMSFRLLLLVSTLFQCGWSLPLNTIRILRDETKEAFLHAYSNYINLAFPYDELQPITCQPRKYDNRTRGTLDDILGNFMLTLVESLDALLLMREFDLFQDAMEKLKPLSFHRDIDVSVFETNIRVLGGLLSAHQLAVHLTEPDVFLTETAMTSNPTPSLTTDHDNTTTSQSPKTPLPPPPPVQPFYDGTFLLNLAIDLGQRMLPAFNTLTGIPIHRVNLMNGFNENEPAYTCTAAGTSFLLEMGLLSRLSGDPSFEYVARRAVKSVWDRRSPLGLVGSLIDINTGAWLGHGAHTSIGDGLCLITSRHTLVHSLTCCNSLLHTPSFTL